MNIKNRNLCPSCFEELTGESCRACGYTDEIASQYPTALPVGIILMGRYLTGRVLGKGGFGITYLAYDLNQNKKVAIKEYLPDNLTHRNTGATEVSTFSGEKGETFRRGADKFFEEAKTLSIFNGHPHIINVYEFFYENNTAYFVMEYLDGIDLKSYVNSNEGRISVEKTIEIILPVIDAVSVIHNAGILHRDISPDNIYICDDGNVKLLDFGAARQVLGEEWKSLSVVLKQGFAPIEQYQTRGKQGEWTDIYALGATMYYCLTGRVPESAMDRVDEDSLKLPSKLGVKIPDGLELVLSKAMAPSRLKRYKSAEELRCDISLAIAGSNRIPANVEKRKDEEIAGTNIVTEDNNIKRIDKVNKKKRLPVVASIVLLIAAVTIAAVIGINSRKTDTASHGEDAQSAAAINEDKVSSTAPTSSTAESDDRVKKSTPTDKSDNTPPKSELNKDKTDQSGSKDQKKKPVGINGNEAPSTGNNTDQKAPKQENPADKGEKQSADATPVLSDDANLKALSVNGYNMTPSFNPDNLQYTVTVDAAVKNLKINALKSNANSFLSINGPGVDKNLTLSATQVNVVSVFVKSQSGKEKVYKINVTRKNEYNKDPNLSNDKNADVIAAPKHMNYSNGDLIVYVRIFNNSKSNLSISSVDFSVYDRHLDTIKNPQHYYAKKVFTDVVASVIPAGEFTDVTLRFTGSDVINPNGDLTCLWWSSYVHYSIE
ncbi:MAG TPA: protein kinase [Clostridia bacterium]|nr:protein kinase [Clostridia bacterium]